MSVKTATDIKQHLDLLQQEKVLAMDTALRNLISLGVPLPHAVAMTSTLPCDLLGLTDRGRLEAGAVADIAVLDPDTLAIEQVWIAGQQVR